MLQQVNVFLVVRDPKWNTVFQVWPHQCLVQVCDHFPTPAGHTITDTSQHAIGLLGHLGTLLAHIQLAVDQHPKILFQWAAFQPLLLKPVVLHGVSVTEVQHPALGLVESCTIDLGPLIQPVRISLQSLPTLKQIDTSTQLVVICKLTEGALNPLIQIIDKDGKQDQTQNRALGNSTCDWSPAGFNSMDHHSALGHSANSLSSKGYTTQTMGSQFLQEDAVGNSVKCHTKIQVDNVHSLTFIH